MEKNHQTTKYFLYARKSTEDEDRQVLSIDSQIDELKTLAKDQDLEIIETFVESKSAKAPGRPIFTKMMDRIYGGEAQGVLCWKLDRLARNPVDGGQISWALQQGVINHIQTFGRAYLPSDNVLMMSVEFGMANQFVRDLSVGVKRGLKRKAEMGWHSGVAPEGYLNTPDREKGFKIIINDPERFPLIRKVWELMLSGLYTVPELLNIVNTEWGYTTVKRKKLGGGPLSRSGLYRILTNPFYAGIIMLNGIELENGGAHVPMVTLDEFNRVQEILGRKGKPRPQKYSFPYSGTLHCAECGRMLTPDKKIKRQKNGNTHHYLYYACKKKGCPQKGIESKTLENQVKTLLEEIALPQDFYDWGMEIVREENKKEWEGQDQVIANLQRQYNASCKRIDGLIDMRAVGQIDDKEFAGRKTDALKEKDRLAELLGDADKRVNSWVRTIDNAILFAEHAGKSFADGDDLKKKEILCALGLYHPS